MAEIAALIDLLTDLHPGVVHAAALALARIGRREGHFVLTRMLGTAPSDEVLRALANIAEDDDWVRLGQTAMCIPDLAPVVLEVLDESGEPRATAVAQSLRRRLSGSS